MDILKLKTELNKQGFGPLALDGPEALVFGPKTTKAVQKFQKKNGLKDTSGIVGPETLSALFPDQGKIPLKSVHLIKPWVSHEKTLALRALDIMLAQVGVKEVPDNTGPAVGEFLGSVGLDSGYSWCMAFIYWAYQKAAAELGVNNPLVKTGGCIRQMNEIDKKYIVPAGEQPQPGDIGIIDLGEGKGHVFAVVEIQVEKVRTVEGNTNLNNSPNGDGVYERVRAIEKAKVYIRIA